MQIIEKSCNFRTNSFPPNAEVITTEVCGEFFKISEDTDLYSAVVAAAVQSKFNSNIVNGKAAQISGILFLIPFCLLSRQT